MPFAFAFAGFFYFITDRYLRYVVVVKGVFLKIHKKGGWYSSLVNLWVTFDDIDKKSFQIFLSIVKQHQQINNLIILY